MKYWIKTNGPMKPPEKDVITVAIIGGLIVMWLAKRKQPIKVQHK